MVRFVINALRLFVNGIFIAGLGERTADVLFFNMFQTFHTQRALCWCFDTGQLVPTNVDIPDHEAVRTCPPFLLSHPLRRLIRLQRDGKRVFDTTMATALGRLLSTDSYCCMMLLARSFVMATTEFPSWNTIATIRDQTVEDRIHVNVSGQEDMQTMSEDKHTVAQSTQSLPDWILKTYIERNTPISTASTAQHIDVDTRAEDDPFLLQMLHQRRELEETVSRMMAHTLETQQSQQQQQESDMISVISDTTTASTFQQPTTRWGLDWKMLSSTSVEQLRLRFRGWVMTDATLPGLIGMQQASNIAQLTSNLQEISERLSSL